MVSNDLPSFPPSTPSPYPLETPPQLTMTRDAIHRVRFALPEDSPLSNTSTLSSPGPRTPPVLNQPLVHVHQPSPYYTLSPALSPNNMASLVPCELHGVLTMPAFDFDVSVDPATNPIVRDNLYVARTRNDPATNPPVPSLTLVSRLLPWEVVISSSAFPFVTIADVLGGLYRALRMPAREEEYFRESPEKQNTISLAYCQRCERALSVELREREKQKGVKRIDFLTGSYRFRGLCKTERPNVWNIKFKS